MNGKLVQRKSGDLTGGFTLIEVMIVVVVIAILATIAYPSYSEYIQRSKRAEAKGALLANAQFFERYFMTNGFYSTVKNSGSPPTLPVTRAPQTGTQNYDITAAVTNTTYTVTATPVNSMAGDACGNLTLTEAGVQGASGALGIERCWYK